MEGGSWANNGGSRFDIEIISDPLCPYCYVAKKNLEQAIETYRRTNPQTEFNLVWKPFYLGPAMRSTGYDKRGFYEKMAVSFPPPAPLERARKACEMAGICLDIRGKTGNSRASQKLIALALTYGPAVQNNVMEDIFRGHFTEGADISDRRYLMNVAVKNGIDSDEAAAVLNQVRYGINVPGRRPTQDVDAEVIRAKRDGVDKVPTFVVRGKSTLQFSGKQDPEVFLELFERLGGGKPVEKKGGFNESSVYPQVPTEEDSEEERKRTRQRRRDPVWKE